MAKHCAQYLSRMRVLSRDTLELQCKVGMARPRHGLANRRHCCSGTILPCPRALLCGSHSVRQKQQTRQTIEQPINWRERMAPQSRIP